MKKLLRKFMPRPLPVWLSHILILAGAYARRSYSQEGEDLILARTFAERSEGFYVDVGAHHPVRFSNTYLLYKRGWRGINIDATPGSMRLFRRWRTRDVNLEVAVGLEEKEATIFLFSDPALNSLDADLAAFRDSNKDRVISTKAVQVRTLAGILQEYAPKDRRIDVLSIDVEGWDLDVLKSNDWEHFRPAYVLVECLQAESGGWQSSNTYRFLAAQGYELAAKTVGTLFFCLER